MSEFRKFTPEVDSKPRIPEARGSVEMAIPADNSYAISDLLFRKENRRRFTANEANRLPSISDLLDTKELRRLGRGGEVFNATTESVNEVIQAETVLGEISYTPKTGEVIVNGESKIIGPRRRDVFKHLIASAGQYSTKSDIQRIYEPVAYTDGKDPESMKFVIRKLRQEIDDPDGKLIKTDGYIGYTVAVPESQEQALIRHTVGEKEIQYSPRDRRLIIDGGDPIKLSPESAILWMMLAREPGRVIPNHDLAPGRKDSVLRARMVTLRKIVGENVIVNDPGRGYYLNN